MTSTLLKFVLFVAVCNLLNGCAGNKATQLREHERRITDLNERALDSAAKGYDTDARKLLQEALQRSLAQDDRNGVSLTLLNQSRLARHSGNLQLASQLVEQALVSATGTIQYADAAQEKALQELAGNRLAEAGRWAEIARTSEQSSLLGRRLNLLARIALLKKENSEATLLAEQALAANKHDGMELERANSLRMLGTIRMQAGQLDEAEELLQEALSLDKQQAASAKIAADLEALSELAGLKGDKSLQQGYLQRARTVRENKGAVPKQ
ncbi:MAG: hypothetical protein OEL57_03230 [Trichlorobacter sp.]|uniref:tetratricopeptide repeat protein n=1 Tax=Trichlorobacter sp. TaxID=2911007 RepID=UPI00255FD77E|nr:tetratricopeptide repeat protein [Trichlorobacter sp.]MDK9716904.1 hypothetical protein [Trichlorobacter sp.]